MESNKADNVSPKQQSSQQLFEQLQRREKQLSEAAFMKLSTEAANLRFFRKFPFVPEQAGSREAREWLASDSHRYKFLLMLLRNCQANDARLIVLANFLNQEGVCKPAEFLGEEFSKYARAAFHGPLGRVSLTSLRQAFIVETWVPYMEKLLEDQRSGHDLESLGYDQGAIQACRGKRNAVAATCQWLAPRFFVTPEALANAHSAVYSRVRKKSS